MSKGTYSHSNRHRMHESLLTKAQRDAWNAMSEIDKLKRENEELKKDKERLNVLLKATRHLADGFRLDNRELKRMLDKAFDAGFELKYDE